MSKERKISRAINFIEYISKPLDRAEMYQYYKINGIKPEKVELYYDFIYSLWDLVTTTHLGDDHMSEQDDINHFNWCWKKTIENFKREKIVFDDNKEIYTYFFSITQESFYSEEKIEDNIRKVIDFWTACFNYRGIKTMSEMEALIDLYKLFNKSLYTV